jgi:FMN phosphatase YigB (HAD superfamily)
MSKTVIFLDLDHTLIENPFASAIFPPLCSKIGMQVGKTGDAILEEILIEQIKRVGEKKGPVQEVDWQSIIESVTSRLGATFLDDIELSVKQHSIPPHSYSYPGAVDTLSEMKKRDWTLIASSKGLWRYQSHVLMGLELHRFFDGFAMPDLLGYRKTERSFYIPFIREAEKVIIVGDNLLEDIFYPRTFGFRTIWKRFDHSKHPLASVLGSSQYDSEIVPDVSIDTLYELVPAILQLMETNEASHVSGRN